MPKEKGFNGQAVEQVKITPDNLMDSYKEWQDNPVNLGKSYSDFLNISLDHMKAGLDKQVSSKESISFMSNNLILNGFLEKDGDSYKIVHVQRFLKTEEGQGNHNKPWTQGEYPEVVTFLPNEVKSRTSHSSSLVLEKVLN